mmetsp:Transcript_13519/g.13093  ORF Transcript_13519/g.13093 Transcript_13519/m.13093 type:complete len:136 (-) Transcript_13519:214-621(-)|eukprot:CAMPEP_0119040076 /NCGR_PEP_ID=MMETSP1177-20130426/9908_1 /TAXON_ID=2985 /ORGANISM="Ochromonas sp, Strain CCMP1899" /LENGTH=135 /DNA_ID=CAMNT_0007004789 /DNA_START=163 /DNA_END=570 /DNA_ORIENTATION=-
MRHALKIGTSVERNIDGVWFMAKIENIDKITKLYTIKYSDDGNIEEQISIEDLRVTNAIQNPLDGFMSIFSFAKKDTLPKPLAGLVEDDSDARSMQKPTITIHKDADTEEAIIINGSVDRIAVGGGLRALRYLKH